MLALSLRIRSQTAVPSVVGSRRREMLEREAGERDAKLTGTPGTNHERRLMQDKDGPRQSRLG